MMVLFSIDNHSFQEILGHVESTTGATFLSRDLVYGGLGGGFYRHHHHGRRLPLCQIKKLQIQR